MIIAVDGSSGRADQDLFWKLPAMARLKNTGAEPACCSWRVAQTSPGRPQAGYLSFGSLVKGEEDSCTYTQRFYFFENSGKEQTQRRKHILGHPAGTQICSTNKR